ncbi:MAG TPA: C2 family cysteine protease [Polyangiaceae bacterium]|nr:C2 family cysteine protease [Polyangiaceae bacterium]
MGPAPWYESGGYDDEELQHPVLFLKQATDAAEVDPCDVRQGHLGDCYLLATLGAMASTDAGRAWIRSAVTENKDGEGHVVSYTVRLYEPQRGRFGADCLPVAVTVDPTLLADHAGRRINGGQAELWPLVIEKACAQVLGGPGALGSGGYPADAMRLLTGQRAAVVSLDAPARWLRPYTASRLASDLATGKMVVLSSRAGLPLHGKVQGGHAYVVAGLIEKDGRAAVDLRDPRDMTRPPGDPIFVDQLTTYFTRVTIGAVP